MHRGYIKLHRKLLRWYGSPSPYRMALWVHLLLKANHQDKKFLFNGNPTVVKRGSLITGRKKLSMETGVSSSYIQKLLKEFENEGMLEQQTTNKSRLITITCWSEYQLKEQQKDNRGTTEEQQKDTNKNVKNEEKSKEQERLIAFPFLLQEYFSKAFENYLDMRKTIKAKATDHAIDLILTKLHKQEVKTAIAMLNQSIENSWKGIFPLKNTAGEIHRQPKRTGGTFTTAADLVKQYTKENENEA